LNFFLVFFPAPTQATMSEKELKAQLARTEQALLEAEKEIDRQRRAAAADAEVPEGAKALIAAVSKVDLPAFWDADPVLWFRLFRLSPRRDGLHRGQV
jgi:hypothetical protein